MGEGRSSRLLWSWQYNIQYNFVFPSTWRSIRFSSGGKRIVHFYLTLCLLEAPACPQAISAISAETTVSTRAFIWALPSSANSRPSTTCARSSLAYDQPSLIPTPSSSQRRRTLRCNPLEWSHREVWCLQHLLRIWHGRTMQIMYRTVNGYFLLGSFIVPLEPITFTVRNLLQTFSLVT